MSFTLPIKLIARLPPRDLFYIIVQYNAHKISYILFQNTYKIFTIIYMYIYNIVF